MESRKLLFLSILLALPLIQNLVLSFLGTKVGFNGKPANGLRLVKPFFVLAHLVQDVVFVVTDLFCLVLVFVIHDPFLMLDVNCVLTNVVFVLHLTVLRKLTY